MIPICLFAKPPVPGLVKTRIGRVVGHELAAELAAALLVDLIEVVRGVPWAVPVIASTGERAEAFGVGPVQVWDQGEGDLGARVERILRRGLAGAAGVMAIGADTVGLTRDRLEAARVVLEAQGSVIGPTLDGGFYLLGLTRCPKGLLARLPWSAPNTCEATEARIAAVLGPVTRLPAERDVDEVGDLSAWLTAVEEGRCAEGKAARVGRAILGRLPR